MSRESCEGFEIAIEMRLHGAGEAEALARLDRHLEGCASCREFDRLGSESEGHLRADAEGALAAANLKRLRARGVGLALSRWNDVGAFFLFIGFAFLLRSSLRAAGLVPGEASLMDWSLALMWIAIPFVEIRRRRRAIEEAFRSDVLLFEMRSDVHQRLFTAGAEDAAQETYLSVTKALRSFRGDSSVSTWVYRIAIRAALRVKAQLRAPHRPRPLLPRGPLPPPNRRNARDPRGNGPGSTSPGRSSRPSWTRWASSEPETRGKRLRITSDA